MPRFREALHKTAKQLCDGLRDQDCQDPRYDSKAIRKPIQNRKALQLCSQVFQTLSLALPSCGDDALTDLMVESVTLHPNSARLLVTLRATAAIDTQDIEQNLAAVKGRLRSEVAASINRRKAPELVFKVT